MPEPSRLGRIVPRRPELPFSEPSGSGKGCGPGRDPFHGNVSADFDIPWRPTHPGHKGGIPVMRTATVLAAPQVSRRDCLCSACRPVVREERARVCLSRDRPALATSAAMKRSESLSTGGRHSISPGGRRQRASRVWSVVRVASLRFARNVRQLACCDDCWLHAGMSAKTFSASSGPPTRSSR